MDKEKLLERSRQENKKGDERERQQMENAQFVGSFVIEAVLVALLALEYVTEKGLGGMVSVAGVEFPFRDFCALLLCLALSVEYGFKAVLVRKKWQIAMEVLFLLGLCMGIYRVFLAG